MERPPLRFLISEGDRSIVQAKSHNRRIFFPPDFALANKFGAGADIAYLAAAQKSLLAGKIDEAVRAARQGIGSGHEDYRLLTILGEALMRSGITPDQPQFAEAHAVLSKAVTIKPNYSDAQLALGKLELIAHHLN